MKEINKELNSVKYDANIRKIMLTFCARYY